MLNEDFEVNLSQIKAKDKVPTMIATKMLPDKNWITSPRRKPMFLKDGLPYLTDKQQIV